jgi:hypothetical protein
MTRLLGIRVSILLPTVLAVVIIVWFVLSPADRLAGTPADHLLGTPLAAYQLDQKIDLTPTPEYAPVEDSEASASAGYICEPGVDRCIGVETDATRAVALASITKDYLGSNGGLSNLTKGDLTKGDGKVLMMEFYDFSLGQPHGASYCFDSKDAVFATLGNLDEAQLLGTIDYSSSDEEHCYIVVL